MEKMIPTRKWAMRRMRYLLGKTRPLSQALFLLLTWRALHKICLSVQIKILLEVGYGIACLGNPSIQKAESGIFVTSRPA